MEVKKESGEELSNTANLLSTFPTEKFSDGGNMVVVRGSDKIDELQ
jgi:hypothetical protein